VFHESRTPLGICAAINEPVRTALGYSISVVTVAVLLLGRGSGIAEFTTAVFTACEGVVAVAVIVIVTTAPLSIVPMLQVTTPAVALQLP
jgi:hypothetical protein